MNQSTSGLFQVAMVDRRSVESPFLRKGRSRKSGHTCTVCGGVFGLWASLAEHKEVHYKDCKSLSSQQPDLEKRTLKSKKLLKKEQLSNKKKIARDGIGKGKINYQPKSGSVTNALSTGLPDSKFSQQNEMKVLVGQCSSNSLSNCLINSKQETELKTNVLKIYIKNLTEITVKNDGDCAPQLTGNCSDTLVPSGKVKLGCRRKFNSEGKEPAECRSSARDDINSGKHEISSATDEQFPNLSEKALEILDIKPHVLNKKHIYAKTSPDEYDSKNIGDEMLDTKFNCAEVSSVKQAEISRFSVTSLREKSKNKVQQLPDCLSRVQNSVLLCKDNFVLQTVSSVKTEVNSKVSSDMSFTINSAELLDVEEEVVCTEDILEPAPFETSRHCQTMTLGRNVPSLNISSDASKLPANMNSCGVSQLNPEESHVEKKSGIQMVSLLKSNSSIKQKCQHNTEESRKGAYTTINSFLMKNKTSETQVINSLSPSSQFLLVKKFKQNSVGRHLSAKQMISLLKPHQNVVTLNESFSEHSNNRKSVNSHSHQSAVGMDVIATDAKVVKVTRLDSKLVTAKKELSTEFFNDMQGVTSVQKCTSSPIILIDFVVNQRTRQDISQPSDVLAKHSDKLLLEKTSRVQMQQQQIDGVKNETVATGTTVDGDHAVEVSSKYVEVGESDLTSEVLSAEITPGQRVKPEKSVHYSDFEDPLKDSYDCLLCSEKFSNPIELDVHHNSQHLCLKCDRVFRQTSNLRKHLRVRHESYRPHRCETCGKCFPFLSSLKEHWVIHSQAAFEKDHTCEVCGKAFTRASGLRKHSKEEHLDVKPYVCVQCQKRFAYLCSLRSHLRAHSSERPFSCDACDQRFKQSSNLRKHVRLHHRPRCDRCQGCCVCVQQTDKFAGCGKSTICEVCGRACEGQKQLMIHMRVHTGEKPEVCDVCGKSFQHKSNLLKHRLKHSGTKAFACKFCDRSFYAKHSLLSHMRLHTGESPFQCDACNKRFCTKNGLQVHSLLHSNMRPFGCSTCGKTFTQLGNLNKHVALHTGERPFVCAYCDKGFVDSSALKRHTLKHTFEDVLECSKCGKRFQHSLALQSHELLHATEQNGENSGMQLDPLACVVCSKIFLNRSNYLRHMKRHRGLPDEVNQIILNPGEYIVCLTEAC